MDFVAKYADYIIDLKQSFSNIAYNTKVIEGYYSKRKIKPKFFFNVYRKTNRVNYATMLITSIICTILLAILGFFITLNQHTKAFVITKYIKDNDIPEIVVSKDSLEENNIILDDYDQFQKILINLSNYAEVPCGFAYDLFEDFEGNKEIAYTFVNSLNRYKNNNQEGKDNE